MDLQRRGFANIGDALLSAAIPGLRSRDSDMNGTSSSPPTPTNTIGPYATALNGVDQPRNFLFTDTLWWSIGAVGFLVLAIRILELLWAQLRQVSAMSAAASKQDFWKFRQWSWMPGMKKVIIYAPLWKKRHNREIRLSSAFNMGTLPSRLHFVILLLYLGSNIAYMLVLNWHPENKWALCAELRGRTGTMALVNMVPLIIFAGRNNPLIGLLQISFDTYNLLHRWVGRTVVILAVIHTLAWMIVQVADAGWRSVVLKSLHETFFASGMVGTLCLVILLVLSLSPIRHAFYETFLNTHIILALIIFACSWIHCKTPSLAGGVALPQLPYITAILCIWFFDRLARMVRLAKCNWSNRGRTEAMVEMMPGEAVRVTMNLPRYVDIKPGTHAYIRLSSINVWENHPFSIAWVDHKYVEEKLPIDEKQGPTPMAWPVSTTVSFVIGAHTGFTRKLYNAAKASPRALFTKAAFEGPYAGHHSMDSYGHVVLFAGATGITHQISYLRHLVQGYSDGTVATRRVTLVWIVRDTDALEWVRPWMDTLLRMPRRKEVLRIKLFVTRPKNTKSVVSASSTVEMFPGRPNVPTILAQEVQEQVGAMCVSVCGPGGLADDVRAAVRIVQDERTVVDFVEESFTW